MQTKKVYQTLEDRFNPDEIERKGPFICRRKGAWLGEGYYFWESHIVNAHWWGAEGARYKNGYIICQAFYYKEETKCFDLVDNEEHLNIYNETVKLMSQNGIYENGKTTVSRVIEYLRNTLKIFRYEATRVYGVGSVSRNSNYSNKSIFDSRYPDRYLDFSPAIQICFYNKSSLGLRDYKIIYPEEYIDGYVV